MQNNHHIRLSQETITPYEAPISQVVYPQLATQQLQVGQPLPPLQIQQGPIYPQQIPQQQYQYPQAQVVYNPTATTQVPPMVSKYPQNVTCVYCQRQIQTVVTYEAGTGAFAIGGLMAAVGLWLGCCLIPCFMQDCKDAVHFCPQCQANLGKKRFLFD